MHADLPAHVLRIEHLPVAAALSKAGHIITDSGNGLFTFGHTDVAEAKKFTDFLKPYNDGCSLCAGTRRSPETGDPCEVCTVVGGSSYPVVP